VANDSDFVCVLRASCRRRGLGALLRAHPRWKPDRAWKAGVPDVIGRIPKTNGFNLCIAEGGEWTAVAALIRRRMRSLSPMIRDGRKIGAKFEIDIGVMLGGGKYWTRSTRFGPRDLAPLLDLGVELCVSAYPPSAPSPRGRKRVSAAPSRAGK
jgi:hypothetical protein